MGDRAIRQKLSLLQIATKIRSKTRYRSGNYIWALEVVCIPLRALLSLNQRF